MSSKSSNNRGTRCGCLAILAIIIGLAIWFFASSGHSANYRAHITANLPCDQTLGKTQRADFWIRNRGDRIPDLILQFGGLGDYYIGSAYEKETGSDNPGWGTNLGSGFWGFGPLRKGGTAEVVLPLTPQKTGNPNIDVMPWAEYESDIASANPDSVIKPGDVGWRPAL